MGCPVQTGKFTTASDAITGAPPSDTVMFVQGNESHSAHLAGWGERLAAVLLDGLIAVVLAFAVCFSEAYLDAKVTTSSTGRRIVHIPVVPFVLAGACALLIALIYFGLFDGRGAGQTLGKRAMRIATRDARNGGQIGFWRGFVRAFICFVLWNSWVVPGVVDALWPLWSRKRQALHDYAVRSLVVKVPQREDLVSFAT